MAYVALKAFRHNGEVVEPGTQLPDDFARNMRSLERTRFIKRTETVTVIYREVPAQAPAPERQVPQEEPHGPGTKVRGGQGDAASAGSRKYEPRSARRSGAGVPREPAGG